MCGIVFPFSDLFVVQWVTLRIRSGVARIDAAVLALNAGAVNVPRSAGTADSRSSDFVSLLNRIKIRRLVRIGPDAAQYRAAATIKSVLGAVAARSAYLSRPFDIDAAGTDAGFHRPVRDVLGGDALVSGFHFSVSPD
jgi:hypothetical protein